MEVEDSMKERVQKISTRTFTIASCPEKTYQDFIKFCEENARNIRYFEDAEGKLHEKNEVIYHVGLRLLLDAFKADAKTMMLYEKIKDIETKLVLLEKKPAIEEKQGIKTFGGK